MVKRAGALLLLAEDGVRIAGSAYINSTPERRVSSSAMRACG
jgi:hypothetical protein